MVSVVFADLVGSTALGERLDPESVRGIVARYFAVMRGAIERHGGRVEKFIGDAVVAVWGVPRAREDDALLAVTAACAMRSGLAEVNEEVEAAFGVRLASRIGVNTGRVVGTGEEVDQFLATGDAVNVAARLEQAAGAGRILISRSTFEAVAHAVEAEPMAPLRVKGKSEPLEAWSLVGVCAQATAIERHLDRPLVGRELELERLVGLLERAATTSQATFATVVGPAGIGKSRLSEALVERAERRGATVMRAASKPYGESTVHSTLADLLRSALGPDLENRVAAVMAGERRADQITEALAGLEPPEGQAPDLDTLRWALIRLLSTMADTTPLLLEFDDVHWAGTALQDTIRALADGLSDQPACLMCFGRPEALDDAPGLAGESIVLRLEPLSASASSALLSGILPNTAPARVRTRIADAAHGNPLFLEQLTAFWAERAGVDLDELPWTVESLIAARLDLLPPAPARRSNAPP